MTSFLHSNTVQILSEIMIGLVWIFHGLYSKILNGIPRHQMIVSRVLEEKFAKTATKAIGLAEVMLGLWVFTGWQRIACAWVQTLAIVGMNTLEVLLAGDLLISAIGMIVLNLGFITLIWNWAFPGFKT